MRRYITRQLAQLVVVILGISILAFVILHVLGDPVLLLLPQNAGKEEFERYRHLLGLDRPLYVQYWKFLSGAVIGDFGKSWYADTPAFKLVMERLPPTIYLTFAGLFVALLISLPLGILAALKRHSWVDNLCTAIAVAGQAIPLFWLGIMLIIVFAVRLKVLPASGYGTWQNFLMPAFCLGAALAPITMRLVRSGVIEVMNMEFIKTARAKGVAEPMVVVKHAFRNACIPVITVHRPAVRPAPRRRHHHGDGVRVAGRGHPHRGVDPQPGLPGRPVRGHHAGARHRDGEPDRGPHRGLHRSAHPGQRMKAVSAPTKVELGELGEARIETPGSSQATLRGLLRLRWGLGAVAVLVLIVLSAALAPWISPHDPLAVNIRHRLAPPAWMEGGTPAHLLGTDQVGRDLLSRMIYGGRVSLVVGVAAVMMSATIGVMLGLGAGYVGGRTDWTIMTIVNVMLTFPFVLLALAVIAVLGPSLVNMIIVLGIAGWPIYARVVRAETMAIREREFVLAGRALGMNHARIVFRQILPNLISAIVVICTLQVAQVIIAESFLSFLGLGIQPPTPAWGNMLGEGRLYMLNSWWIATFPGLAIFVTTLVINLMGNALRDWLDPHIKL